MAVRVISIVLTTARRWCSTLRISTMRGDWFICMMASVVIMSRYAVRKLGSLSPPNRPITSTINTAQIVVSTSLIVK